VLGDDVEVLACDVRGPEGLDDAVAGASVVVSAVHGFLGGRGAGPRDVDERGNAHLVDAAARAGASVVLVSVVGAAPESPLELCRAKYAAEQHLRAAATPWTIVRAGPFLQTWLTVLTQTAGKSGRPMIFGRGEQPLPFVCATDVAELVARAATDASLRQQILELTGSPMTMTELAQALQRARGWHGSVRRVPRPVLRTFGALARPVNPAFARKNRAALAMDTTPLAARGDADRLLGRAPRGVDDALR
ncbi:MAG: hypothetical protein QOH17_762, partial [Pseudonocardiales bacterium]|nr:hypothetical protein [Pseudonocardiales bacterium]